MIAALLAFIALILPTGGWAPVPAAELTGIGEGVLAGAPSMAETPVVKVARPGSITGIGAGALVDGQP
jgi:hypothetical protein